MTVNRRLPQRKSSRIDSKQVRIFKCKFCRQPVTFSYGNIDRDGKKLLTNVDGTRHIDEGGPRK
jgi:hypothetical protein